MIPAGALLTFLAAALVFTLSRPAAALAVIGAVCYVTQGQQIEVGGFHFTAIRIVLLTGLIRALVRGDLRKLEFNKIDWAVTLYPILLTIVSSLRVGTREQFVYQLGLDYDILLSYYVFRCLITDWKEMELFLRGLGLLVVPLAMSMIFESLSRHNLFAWMGGIEGLNMREGRPRCQGAFRSGITAGSFGATLLPIFAMMMFQAGRHRLVASAGLLSTLVIVYTSNSSGPLMGLLGGIVALAFWPLREDMRRVRWWILAALIGLHMVMKAPVWFLIAKISDLTGGDGWYRSQLINQFIHYFSDWWLLGTSDTAEWMPTGIINPVTGKVSADMTNQYVNSGVNGGLWSFLVFVLIIVRCFKGLGNAAKTLRPNFRDDEILLWGIGAALFAHAVTILSVTYWDQMYVAWWGLLAIISSVTSDLIRKPLVEFEDETPEVMITELEAA